MGNMKGRKRGDLKQKRRYSIWKVI